MYLCTTYVKSVYICSVQRKILMEKQTGNNQIIDVHVSVDCVVIGLMVSSSVCF